MELTKHLTIDKNSSEPAATQIINQIVELIENHKLTDKMSILPADYAVFAKELGISRASGCRIYNNLREYGYFEHNHFIINNKNNILQQFEKLMPHAIENGITLEEITALYHNAE